MKKLALILFAFVLIASACTKEEEETEEPKALNPTATQKGFCIEWTATTCSICGSKGGPLIHKYSVDAPHSVVIALHVNGNSDPMADNQLAYGFSDDRPSGGGIPSFWVGDLKTSTSDQEAMNDLIKTGNAVAGIDIKYTKEGSNMKVETLTKFFGTGTGDYYLSVYILEDGIDGSSTAPAGYVQPGTSSSYPNDDYKHNFVIRASSMNNSVMGEKIVTNPASGKEIAKNYTIALDPTWTNTVYAVAVLWKYDANATIKYSYVNAIRK